LQRPVPAPGFSVSEILFSEIPEKPLATVLNHVQNQIESLAPQVVGIGHLGLGEVLGETQEKSQALLSSGRTNALQVGQVLLIHGQNQIKLVEIASYDLPRSEWRKVVAPTGGRRGGARIGRFPDVIGSGSGGIYLHLIRKPLRLDHRPKHSIGGGRAADIAETDEEYTDHENLLRYKIRNYDTRI
jgi:hypothetical protein